MVIRSVLPSLGSSQRQILYFGQRRDYKGDEVSPSVVLRLSNCLQSWNVTLLSQSISIWRASAPYSYMLLHQLYVLYLQCCIYTHMIWVEIYKWSGAQAHRMYIYCIYCIYTVHIHGWCTVHKVEMSFSKDASRCFKDVFNMFPKRRKPFEVF